MTRESMQFDVLIVGAGPAGLSAAIELARLSDKSLQIAVLEKGAYVGAHLLSGALLDATAMDEFLPTWRTEGPTSVPVTEDDFYFLTQSKSFSLPVPKLLQNKGSEIISLGELCQWLGKEAEQLGVNIFTGFAGSALLFNEDKTAILGVQTGDFGLDRHGNATDRYQAGVNIFAKQTLLAEGCRGSLSEQVIHHFNLRDKKSPPSYGIGIKELWRIPNKLHQAGKVIHTLGWPLDRRTYGGGFLYHFKENLVELGLVVALDYQNPYLDPFQELQQFKRHPLIKALLEDGECIGYGARALNESGWQSLPKLSFAGGALIGCAAGMLNVGRLKGIHNAIRSGRLAAEQIYPALNNAEQKELISYQKGFEKSGIARELYQVRNIRPGFHAGTWLGLLHAAVDQYILRGKAPWTLGFKPDHLSLKRASQVKPLQYPKPDNKLTFDKLTQVYLTATSHREDQPCHLMIKNKELPTKVNLTYYEGPETRYCPAQVYEYVQADGKMRLQINAANCIHCKTCDIKDPEQNIVWQTPEGGEGPHYRGM